MDRPRSLCVALIALTLLGACAPGAAPPETAPAGEGRAPTPAAVAPLSPPVHVRIGGLLTLGLAPFVVAESRGYFAEEGLEVDYITFDSGARMVAPLAAGQLEVGQGAHSAGLFNALATGIPLKIVADNGLLIPGRNTSQIVMRKSLADQGFHGAADLRGRSIAFTAAGSTVHINVGRFLDLQGVRADEMTLVEMGFPDMNAALANGALDFADQSEPLATFGASQGNIVRVMGVADYYPQREVS